MEKVGILTFHASHNYGSNLQAYALKAKVAELGYCAEIINFRSDLQKECYRVFTKRKGLKYFLKNVYMLSVYNNRKKKYELFENFIKNELKVDKEIKNEMEFKKVANTYMAIIAGSDQIWNFSATDYSDVYLLPGEGYKKISYAVSCGENNPIEKPADKVTVSIKDFDYISVRDNGTNEFVKGLGVGNTSVVLDPTLLYGKGFYEYLIDTRTPLIDGEYIYLYTLGNSAELAAIAKDLSRQTGLKVYISHVSGTHYMFGFKKKMASGPKEFLNHIKYAKYIITSSYHATIFSIIFHKQFWSYRAEKDNRKRELLEKLDLLERSIDIDNCEAKFKNSISEEKYQQVDNIVERERIKSIDFLKEALK